MLTHLMAWGDHFPTPPECLQSSPLVYTCFLDCGNLVTEDKATYYQSTMGIGGLKEGPKRKVKIRVLDCWFATRGGSSRLQLVNDEPIRG